MWTAKTELFENADLTTVICAHALSCILSVSVSLWTSSSPGLPGLFNCHVTTIFPLTKWIGGSGGEDALWTENILSVFGGGGGEGKDTEGLLEWTEKILCVFKYMQIVVDGASEKQLI